jgi:aconitate hydratase
MYIYDASLRYRKAGVPLVILAGKEYGSGSSRDWAAKGPMLLGVRFVIAESYERIHRSNLVGMGILPLQYKAGETAATLGLTGDETFDIPGLAAVLGKKSAGPRTVKLMAKRADGRTNEIEAVVRIDTPQEILYYEHGGILHFVLRQLLAS